MRMCMNICQFGEGFVSQDCRHLYNILLGLLTNTLDDRLELFLFKYFTRYVCSRHYSGYSEIEAPNANFVVVSGKRFTVNGVRLVHRHKYGTDTFHIRLF